MSKSDLLAPLDKIILTQLRALLTEPALPALVPPDQAMPYNRLPALGHLAVYTLNLIVVRTYLAEAPPSPADYNLDERDLGDQADRVRAWDRLAAIWRSWFPAESLAALATVFTAIREETRITLLPFESQLLFGWTTPLAAAYNASIALADNLTTGSMGLHLMAIAAMPEHYLEVLRGRVEAEVTDLTPALDFAESRISRRGPADLPVFRAQYTRRDGDYEEVPPGYLPVGHEVEAAEMGRLLLISPQRQPIAVRLTGMGDFARLSRYAAQVAIDSRIPLEPAWLADLLAGASPSEWRDLLAGPAAVPPLLAALTQLDDTLCATIAEAIDELRPDRIEDYFDISTATTVAVLAWRGTSVRLCKWALGSIVQACELNAWKLRDIPDHACSALADLLMVSGRDVSFSSVHAPRITFPSTAISHSPFPYFLACA